MDSHQNSICCNRFRHILISLLFLSILSLTHMTFMAEGRAISKPSEAASPAQRGMEGMAMVIRAQIGSRPPRCDRRCNNCGHCEAIQVPIIPQFEGHKNTHFYSTPTIAYSRGDDITNYKPMSWKCKCGDFIFNP